MPCPLAIKFPLDSGAEEVRGTFPVHVLISINGPENRPRVRCSQDMFQLLLIPRIPNPYTHAPESSDHFYTSHCVHLTTKTMSPDQLEHILSEPALHHPPGVISNLSWKEHAHEQKWFYIVVTLCHCIPGIFLLLRLYTKIVVVRKLEFVDCECFG